MATREQKALRRLERMKLDHAEPALFTFAVTTGTAEDARTIAAAVRRHGFETTVRTDGTAWVFEARCPLLPRANELADALYLVDAAVAATGRVQRPVEWRVTGGRPAGWWARFRGA